MKKIVSSTYIDSPTIVNDEMIKEAERIENNPEKMLQLIDLIFLCTDQENICS